MLEWTIRFFSFPENSTTDFERKHRITDITCDLLWNKSPFRFTDQALKISIIIWMGFPSKRITPLCITFSTNFLHYIMAISEMMTDFAKRINSFSADGWRLHFNHKHSNMGSTVSRLRLFLWLNCIPNKRHATMQPWWDDEMFFLRMKYEANLSNKTYPKPWSDLEEKPHHTIRLDTVVLVHVRALKIATNVLCA